MSSVIKRPSQTSRGADRVNARRARRLERVDEAVDSLALDDSEELSYNPDGDSWRLGEYGEEHRYAQTRPHRRARDAYQAAAALAHQRNTHALFYMEDLGRDPAEEAPPAAAVTSLQPSDQARDDMIRTYAKPTRFYPDGGQDDRITRIQPVGRAQLQRVLPSYELSTAETRESGLGPALESTSYRLQKRRTDSE